MTEFSHDQSRRAYSALPGPKIPNNLNWRPILTGEVPVTHRPRRWQPAHPPHLPVTPALPSFRCFFSVAGQPTAAHNLSDSPRSSMSVALPHAPDPLVPFHRVPLDVVTMLSHLKWAARLAVEERGTGSASNARRVYMRLHLRLR